MKRSTSLNKDKKEQANQLNKSGHESTSGWTFLSNHSHVIICLARDPEMRLRDIAVAVGITERASIRIISELEDAGYIIKERVGRRNRYSIVADKNFRHPLEAHHSIRGILALAKNKSC
jgi:DNA-binding MarR family transcriptional regulator